MNHIATIRSTSSIHRVWRERCQMSGVLDGVTFRYRGFEYVSDELPADKVTAFMLRQDQAVRIESFGTPPAEEADKDDTDDTQEQLPARRQRRRLSE